jgi:siroheme synthase (precorrin-2 oxidase/ferrochelatase)
MAPVFMDLAGRGVVFLSAEAALAALAKRLLAGGAAVSAFDPAPDPSFAELVGVRLTRRRWRSSDLRGAALVIAGAREARPLRARAAAKTARAVFHAPDSADLSDVVFGQALVVGPLAIGLGAGGLPAGMEGVLRAKISAALPAHAAAFLDAADLVARETLPLNATDAAADAVFWREAAEIALSVSGERLATDAAGWAQWLRARRSQNVATAL